MLEFWQNLPLHLNPIIFSIGHFSLRWYSLGYILALITIYLFLKKELQHRGKTSMLTIDQLENILLFSFLGALLGGRIGYVLFYDWPNFIAHPWKTVLPFSGDGSFIGFYGMSFHGGLVGAILFGWLATRKYGLDFYKILNFIIPAFPLGYFWGRMGNFMNGELYGRFTESKIGMHFENDNWTRIAELTGGNSLRHPSQLYEALGEGIILFFILFYFSKKKAWQNKLFPLFLIGYGAIRFIIEFFRQPDAQLGFVFLGWMTMGQVLCVVMMITGVISLIYNYSRLTKNNS